MKHKLVSISVAVLGLVMCYYWWSEPFFWPMVLGLLIAYVVLLALGSYFIQWNFYMPSTRKVHNGVCLTFDDGPDPSRTPQILDILADQNTKAAFFLIGRNVEKYPEIVRRISNEGHVIGNHSYSHNWRLPFKPDFFLRRDIEKCNKVITAVTGKEISCFRPPFGVTNPNFRRVLRRLCMTSVGWSIRSFDTVDQSRTTLLTKLKSKIKHGDIVLLHDTQDVTVEMLPDLIKHFKQNGTPIVPLHD